MFLAVDCTLLYSRYEHFVFKQLPVIASSALKLQLVSSRLIPELVSKTSKNVSLEHDAP